MRKIVALLFMLSAFFVVTGCGTNASNSNVKPTTQKILNKSDTTWILDQSVSSKKSNGGLSNSLNTSSVSKTNTIDSWTTSKGQFSSFSVQYKQISLSKFKKAISKQYMKSYQKKIHYLTVDQVNSVLKKLDAKTKITKLSDLVFIETKENSMPLDQAFVAKGHHLYSIKIQYMDDNEESTIDRGSSFIDTKAKKSAKPVDFAKLNGTWIAPETTTSSTDTGKIMIQDGYLYQHRYDSYERSQIQNLSKYSLMSLNQNATYSLQKLNAAKAGYQLTRDTVASGDSVGYLYLFLNQNRLIRIGNGQATEYKKTSELVAVNDLPQDIVTIYTEMDQKNPSEYASTITSKADAPVVGLADSIKYITDADAGQITNTKGIGY